MGRRVHKYTNPRLYIFGSKLNAESSKIKLEAGSSRLEDNSWTHKSGNTNTPAFIAYQVPALISDFGQSSRLRPTKSAGTANTQIHDCTIPQFPDSTNRTANWCKLFERDSLLFIPGHVVELFCAKQSTGSDKYSYSAINRD